MSSDEFPAHASVRPPTPEREPRLRLMTPILIVLAALVASVVAFGVLSAGGLSDDSAGAIAAFVGSLGILGFGLIARHRLPAHERRQVTSRRWSLPAALGIGLALGVGARLVIGIIVSIGQAVDPSVCRKLLELDDDLVPPALWHKVLLTLALVVLAPLGEELVFRGLFLRGLARRMSFPLAAVVSGVVFSVAHPQYWTLWPLLIGISLFGTVAAFVYRTMGYPANVMMHAVFNGVAAVFLFADFGLAQGDVTCE